MADRKLIKRTLEKLSGDEFKMFKRELEDRANFDGQEPLSKAALENKNMYETIDVIQGAYSSAAVQIKIIANILGEINKNAIKDEFVAAAGAPSVPVAAASNGSAASVTAAPKGAAASSPEVAWVDKHKRALINRVTCLDGILDVLVEEKIMKNEDYEGVRSERTDPGRMRELFTLLDKRGAKAKRAFYKGLVELEECLIEDLNEQA